MTNDWPKRPQIVPKRLEMTRWGLEKDYLWLGPGHIFAVFRSSALFGFRWMVVIREGQKSFVLPKSCFLHDMAFFVHFLCVFLLNMLGRNFSLCILAHIWGRLSAYPPFIGDKFTGLRVWRGALFRPTPPLPYVNPPSGWWFSAVATRQVCNG